VSEQNVIAQAQPLAEFCSQVFQTLRVSPDDAATTADVLVAADLRGISSHGVARLRRYVNGLRDGVMLSSPDVRVVHETQATALIDGGAGLGQPVSAQAMRLALQKADEVGAGFVSVRNSNHYGIAAYYSMMALDHDCIGISMTNAAVLVVPTHGRNAMLGTNPISVAAPAGEQRAYVLDMATSTVPRGKLEVYTRSGTPIPVGWATDGQGVPTHDAALVLDNLSSRSGGGLLPLGGAGELLGGHKGYGLALLVDVLAGVLPGAGYADRIYPKTPEGRPLPADVGHFFGALRIDGFRSPQEFKASMDDIVTRLKESSKAEGQGRIFIHGEKEFDAADVRLEEGIPLHPKVAAELRVIASETGVGLGI